MLSVMADVRVGQWNSKSDITSGMSGGLPLTVFDKAMENTIVISPFSEFMATSSHLDTSSNPRVLQLGVFGKADKVTKAEHHIVEKFSVETFGEFTDSC